MEDDGSPSPTSDNRRRGREARPTAGAGGRRPATRSPRSASAEAAKLTASTSMAGAAPTTWTSAPAAARPATCASDSGQLAVAVDQLRRRDQDRQVGLVVHVDEDGQHTAHQGHHEQLGHGEHAGRPGDRDAGEHERPACIAGDHFPSPRQAIDDHTGGQPHQQERHRRRRRQEADLEGSDVQSCDGQQREGQKADLASQAADRLTTPQHQEVTMPPQRIPRGPTHRSSFADRPDDVPGGPHSSQLAQLGTLALSPDRSRGPS